VEERHRCEMHFSGIGSRKQELLLSGSIGIGDIGIGDIGIEDIGIGIGDGCIGDGDGRLFVKA
jgi:hypothetical protein